MVKKRTTKEKLTIGIPRALFYYKKPYFWPTFFEELGCSVIISPPTQREILETGCKNSEIESCLPVKVLQGHIFYLLDKKIDYLFVPRIISLRENHSSCPKFFGLPDLAKLVSKKEVKVLSPTIDFNKEDFNKTAWQKEKQAKEELNKNYLNQIESLERKVVLISHPYNLYDDFINLKIKEKLEKNGLEVLTIDALPFEFQTTFSHWDFASEMLNQAKEISKRAISGAIQISSFGCGCDSVIKEFIERIFREKKIPFLSLMIDEHTAEAGLITRLEAFVDTLN